jgi:hypothetical protein
MLIHASKFEALGTFPIIPKPQFYVHPLPKK